MRTGRRLGWCTLAACLLLVGCSMTARRATSGRSHVPAPIVVVGVGGLTWDVISPEDTPRLWELLDGGAAAGATAVRQIGPSCPVDGWLSLSSGRATAGPRRTVNADRDADRDDAEPDDVNKPHDDTHLSNPDTGIAKPDDRESGTAELGDVGASSPAPVADRRNGSCGPVPGVPPTHGAEGTVDGGQAVREVVVPQWQGLQDLQSSWEFSPQLGVLADSLAELGVCATAVRPGAALALADSDGVVRRYQDALGRDSFDCPITVVDAGSIAGPAGDLSALDRRVGEVLDRAPDDASVLVTGVSEAPGGRPELAAAVLTGPPVSGEPPFLVTLSTRWDGVIRLLDVPSTLMAAVDGSDPADFSGAPIRLGGQRPADPEETVRVLDDVTRAEQVRGTWADDFRNWLGAAQLVLYGLALLALQARDHDRLRALRWTSGHRWARRPGEGREDARNRHDVAGQDRHAGQDQGDPGRLAGRVLAAAVLFLAALPVASYLVTLSGWWRAGAPDRALWLGMAAIAAGIAVVAGRLPKRPLWWATGGLSVLTFLVLVVDGLSGTTLHRGSLLGPSPALGGRFFGFGNDTFCVFIVVALLATGAVAQDLLTRGRQRLAVGSVIALGAVTVLVDVWPTWGGDVGGGLALLPGIALLALVVAGVDVTVTRLAGAAAGGVAVVAGVAAVDWLRPERERTHLGRFVQDLLDGDAWEIVARKAGYARDSLNGGVPMWITLAVLVAAAAALLRPERHAPGPLRAAFQQWPTLRATLGAILLTVVLGSLVNDYGLRIATISLTMGLPFVALTCARAASFERPSSVTDSEHSGRNQEQVRA